MKSSANRQNSEAISETSSSWQAMTAKFCYALAPVIIWSFKSTKWTVKGSANSCSKRCLFCVTGQSRRWLKWANSSRKRNTNQVSWSMTSGTRQITSTSSSMDRSSCNCTIWLARPALFQSQSTKSCVKRRAWLSKERCVKSIMAGNSASKRWLWSRETAYLGRRR